MPPKKRGRPPKWKVYKPVKKPRVKRGRGRPPKLTGVPFADPTLSREEREELNRETLDPRDFKAFDDLNINMAPDDFPVIDQPPGPEDDPPVPPSPPHEDLVPLVDVFRRLAETESLQTIAAEVVGEGGRRRPSHTINNALLIYDYALAEYPSETAKFIEIFKTHPPPVIISILKYLHLIIEAAYPNVNTRAALYKDLKTVLKEHTWTVEQLQVINDNLTVGREVRIQMGEDYRKQIAGRHGEQVVIQETAIYDTINYCKLSEDWKLGFIAVGLMTGARLSEVIWRSEFKPVEGKENWVTVVGTAKERLDEPKIITKPVVGGTAQDVKDIVDGIRYTFDTVFKWNVDNPTREQARVMSTKTAQMINPVVAKMFDNWGLTFHALRGLYAEAAYMAFPPADTMSKAKYVAAVLGHDPDNLTTTLSYQRFKINPLASARTDLPTMVVNLALQLEEFKKKLEDEHVFPVLQKGQVEFQDSKGDKFILTRQPNRHDKKHDERMARVDRHVRALEAKGVNPTFRNLQKLGYGTTTIKQYWQGQDRDKQPTRRKEQKENVIDTVHRLDGQEAGEIIEFDPFG